MTTLSALGTNRLRALCSDSSPGEPGAENTIRVVDLVLPAHGGAQLVALSRVGGKAGELSPDDLSGAWRHLDAVTGVCAELGLVTAHDHGEILTSPDTVGLGGARGGDVPLHNHFCCGSRD